jgi:peroxiredoxin Q/BCP
MKSLIQMEMLNMPAPEFRLKDHKGMPHRITDFIGQPIILYFYPKDMTPGCTLEAQEFRDHIREIEDENAVVIGISPDDAVSHKRFCEGENLNFTLLSDPEGEVARLYDVWKQKNTFGTKTFGNERTTFLIDAQGKIRKIYNNVKPVGHANQVLKDLKEL